MAKRTDSNHKEILKLCREIPGLSVFSTHEIGKGFPDIVIGYKGFNYLVEIKDGAKSASHRKLTDSEVKFHSTWKGLVSIVTNRDDLLTLLQIC